MDDLQKLRNQIDAIDAQLIEILAKRQDIAREIGQYKLVHKLPIFDKQREEYLAQYHKQLAVSHNISFDLIKEIFDLIIKESRKIQET